VSSQTSVRRSIRVALVRGRHLNSWEMQNFEGVGNGAFLTAFGSTTPLHTLEDLNFPITALSGPDARLRWLPKGRYQVSRRLWGASGPDHLFGLEDALAAFDIIHAADTHFDFTYQAVAAKLRYGSKLVNTCWETIPFQYADDKVLYARKLIVHRHTDMFIATTGKAKEALVLEGVDPDRIRILYPGVNLQRFAVPTIPREDPWLPWRIPNSLRVLFVGRVVPEKGIRDLLLAIAHIRDVSSIGHRIEAAIVGMGQHALVQEMVRSLNLSGTVLETGQIPYSRMPSLFWSSDLFVLPSVPTPYWEEQFGMVLAEAMASGVAVVATASGAIPEVVGDAGKLVPPYNHRALAAAIEQLLLDNGARATLGSMGTKRANEVFDSEKVALRLRDIYEEVMSVN
jgi:alpha-maltose-1-phosphate synthase